MGQVVGKESAIIGDGYEDSDSIHADHVGMAKFSNPSEAGYKKIVHVIRQLLKGIQDQEPNPLSANQLESM